MFRTCFGSAPDFGARRVIPILNFDCTQLVSNMVRVQYACTFKTNIWALTSNATNVLRLVSGEGVDRIVWFR